MNKNHVRTSIDQIRNFVEIQKRIVSNPDAIPKSNYSHIRQTFNTYIIQTLIGMEFVKDEDKKTGVNQWTLKGMKPLPNRFESEEIFSIICTYLQEIEPVYLKYFEDDGKDDWGAVDPRKGDKVLDEKQKINTKSFNDLIQMLMLTPLTIEDFRKISILGNRYRNNKRLKYTSIGSAIIIGIIGAVIVTNKIMKSRNEYDSELIDEIEDDIDEIVDAPTTSIEDDDIPA